jgi:hypothetical protein
VLRCNHLIEMGAGIVKDKIVRRESAGKKTEMLSCRIRPELLHRLKQDAEAGYRSMAAQLMLILDRYYAKKDGDGDV